MCLGHTVKEQQKIDLCTNKRYINVTARYHKILLCPFLTSKPFVWLLQLQTFWSQNIQTQHRPLNFKNKCFSEVFTLVDVTQCRLVVGFWGFKTTYWTDEDEPTGCPEMSVAKNQPKLSNTPVKRRLQLHGSEAWNFKNAYLTSHEFINYILCTLYALLRVRQREVQSTVLKPSQPLHSV